MTHSYDDFFEALGKKESHGDYKSINTLRFMGKYQMGELSLIDLGYYTPDGHSGDNRYSDKFWTGKEGIKSKTDFLNSPQIQEKAVREYAKHNWLSILNFGLDRYIGRNIHEVPITISGLLAGAHNQGPRRVSTFIKYGVNSKDGYGTEIKSYIKDLSGYDTPFKSRKKLLGLKKDKQGQTVMYQIEGKDWISVADAIQMVKAFLLDAVIVTNSKGTVFLKTPPDHSTDNNLG